MFGADAGMTEPDEDDWPTEGSKLSSFSDLEKLMTCGICKGFLTSPKELPCGHLYCAECISRSMDNTLYTKAKNECPTCRTAALPGQCKATPNIGKMVHIFKELRQDLLEMINSKEEDKKKIAALEAESTPSGSAKKRKGRPRKSKDPESRLAASTSEYEGELSSVLGGAASRGKVIEKMITPYNFGNTSSLKKVKDQLGKVTEGARSHLRLDGDVKKLKERYRNFIHIHNAQLASSSPLTVEEVVKQCNQQEKVAEKAAAAAAPTEVALEKSGERGFQDLIRAGKDRIKKAKSLDDRAGKGAKEEPKGGKSATQSSSSSSSEHRSPAQAAAGAASSSSSLASTPATRAVSPKEGKENDDSQRGVNMGSASTSGNSSSSDSPDEYMIDSWCVVWSSKVGRVFYFDKTDISGQFDAPAALLPFFADVHSEEEMKEAVKRKLAADPPVRKTPVPVGTFAAVAKANAAETFDLTQDVSQEETPGTATSASGTSPGASSPVEWQCKTCTFVNKEYRAQCEMCSTACHLAIKRTRAQRAKSGGMQTHLTDLKRARR